MITISEGPASISLFFLKTSLSNLFILFLFTAALTTLEGTDIPTLVIPPPLLSPYITRVGISVPSRVVRAAVKRNRIKRLQREVFRKNKEMLAGPSDIVIIAKRGAEGLSYKNIEEIFLKLKIDINYKE